MLRQGSTNYFRVSAVTSAGTGMPAITVMKATGVSSPVRNLVASISDRTATLNWTAPVNTGGAPIIGYRIEQYSGDYATWVLKAENTWIQPKSPNRLAVSHLSLCVRVVGSLLLPDRDQNSWITLQRIQRSLEPLNVLRVQRHLLQLLVRQQRHAQNQV